MTTGKAPSLAERLARGVVLCAEGYVFELERRGYIKSGPYVPEVVLDFPEAVKELHREFVRAGSDVVLALTYYAHRDKLKDVNRARDVRALNRQAVSLAREVARESGALLAGNICNTWVYDPNDKKRTARHVRRIYEEQVGWAVEGGADFILAETLEWFGEAQIALETIKSFNVPAVINLDTTKEQTVDGVEFGTACRRLADGGALAVGLNCARGPATMLPILRKIIRAVGDAAYVAALPVAYRTSTAAPSFMMLRRAGCRHGFPVELDPFVLTRYEMADFAVAAQKLGARFIGVCCGGAPHHVRAMAEALGRRVPASEYSPMLERHAIMGEGAFARGKDRKLYARQRKIMRGEAR
ncbi:MAG TPA: homocysteine S-methyltransferase family protein [Steroidobacteraceae bacterium]|nr:homocysteine S-methyltransferase family protein [Steroidobacteraceae bacterium]